MTIDGVNIPDIGATALLAYGVILILTGRLIPRRTYEDMKEDRNTWRDTAQTRSDQIGKLLGAVDTSTTFIEKVVEEGKKP